MRRTPRAEFPFPLDGLACWTSGGDRTRRRRRRTSSASSSSRRCDEQLPISHTESPSWIDIYNALVRYEFSTTTTTKSNNDTYTWDARNNTWSSLASLSSSALELLPVVRGALLNRPRAHVIDVGLFQCFRRTAASFKPTTSEQPHFSSGCDGHPLQNRYGVIWPSLLDRRGRYISTATATNQPAHVTSK